MLSNLGNKIRTLREKRNISPKDFADRLEIDLSTLNRIENNKISAFKPSFLLKIAELLESNIAELFDQNAPVAIQTNQEGQNINCVNFHITQAEKIEKLCEQLIASKDELIKSLQEQIVLLAKK